MGRESSDRGSSGGKKRGEKGGKDDGSDGHREGKGYEWELDRMTVPM